MNPLQALAKHGQSVWLDYIRRGMTRSGELAALIANDGLRGMTSNPAIFLKAIAGSDDYDDVMGDLVGAAELDARQIFEQLAVVDIREAADVLRPVYDDSEGVDGYVSLEVSPSLAFDADGTVEEARRLWAAVERPNLMIKVPGTPPGLAAIERLIGEGINVNVTLIFAKEAYRDIANAYLAGLEQFARDGGDVARVASVASFFISRIDAEVDHRLAALAAATDDAETRAKISALGGKAAVANAKLAYRIYQELIASDRWRALAERGARPQRLLWASTGTKNAAYSDVKYVDELCGPDTVNTIPPKTYDAFRDHGTPEPALLRGLDQAQGVLDALAAVGVSIDEVTDVLLERGVAQFEEAIDSLLATIARMQRRRRGARLDRMTASLPEPLAGAVAKGAAAWDAADGTPRLWAKDPTRWTNSGEQKWLAWLDVVEQQRAQVEPFAELAALVKQRGFTHALLLGMGGSSLGPDVLAHTLAQAVPEGAVKLRVVDSTDPGQVAAIGDSVPLASTLIIVASKSGSTLEPAVLLAHFLERMKAAVGPERAGEHFIAITDPGSALEAQAAEHGFLRVFAGVPEIGGRFSVFSNFGMVPAAVMGLDVPALLGEAALMVSACRDATATANPGVELGLIMGHAAAAGRDKLTLVASPGIALFGAWLEQLVAESTGKQGQAIIPLEGEPLQAPERYGDDRLFVVLRLRATPHLAQDRAIATLEAAGHAVIRIELDDAHALPQEMFRWEIATAVAGAVMGINPFDQPDVEAAKVEARAMMDAYEQNGALPPETPFYEQDGLALYADAANAERLRAAAGADANLVGLLRAHLESLEPSDYLALLAFVSMSPAHTQWLQRMRTRVVERFGTATCVGFGPRFLHSTGQAYKGGPNRGVFLQITGEDAHDLPVPGQRYSFGVVKAAQARGDFKVLASRGRRALRVHLGPDTAAGLAALDAALGSAIRAHNEAP